MKVRRLAAPAFLAAFLAGCAGGETRSIVLDRPVDIRPSGADVTLGGRTTRLVYVANEQGGSVAVLDQRKETFADTDGGDDLKGTPLAVGGRLSALAVQDLAAPRIFVADASGRKLLAFDAQPPADPASEEVAHTPVDLGGEAEGRAGRPTLRDSGRRSSPVFENLAVDASLAKNESWELKFEGDSVGYEVKGSRSGRQSGRALEGVPYATDDGALSFTIQSGGDPTTRGDKFYFGTLVARPLALAGRPIDLKIDGNRLYIVCEDPPSVILFALDSLAPEAEPLPLTVGPAGAPRLGKAALEGGHLYIPEESVGGFFDLTLSDLSVAWVNTRDGAGREIPVRALGVDSAAGTLYLLVPGSRDLIPWRLEEGVALASLRLSAYGSGFVSFARPADGVRFGLVPSAGGVVEVVDLENRTRVDTRNPGESKKSKVSGIEFSDTGDRSTPKLLTVGTTDGVTLTERWQLVYEGVVPSASGLAATVSGTRLVSAGAAFAAAGISTGDRAILEPFGRREEVAVAAALSEEELELAAAPAAQGEVAVEIRAGASYVVIGSVSGAQATRAAEGASYTSDDGRISVNIQGSRIYPTTRDDFFTFVTREGVDPVGGTDLRGGSAIAVFTRPGEAEPTAYVAQRDSDAISALNLRNFTFRKLIR